MSCHVMRVPIHVKVFCRWSYRTVHLIHDRPRGFALQFHQTSMLPPGSDTAHSAIRSSQGGGIVLNKMDERGCLPVEFGVCTLDSSWRFTRCLLLVNRRS